jgi:hypothetical protein
MLQMSIPGALFPGSRMGTQQFLSQVSALILPKLGLAHCLRYDEGHYASANPAIDTPIERCALIIRRGNRLCRAAVFLQGSGQARPDVCTGSKPNKILIFLYVLVLWSV